MRSAAWICAVLTAPAAFAAEKITVAVCNQEQIPLKVVEHAEDEAAYVFRAVDVEIQWNDCRSVGDQDSRLPEFIIRVLRGGHITKAGPVSLEAMGRAFLDNTGEGYLADAYYGAVQELAIRFPAVDGDCLLGYTIAHELGHLLIGRGHRASGLMRATWRNQELRDLRHRNLKFNSWERATILLKLRTRAAAR